MKRLKVIFFLLAVFLPFVIYVLTASRSVYGVDSGDFIYTAWFFGTAHSPGYPIYTLLLAIWSRIPFGLDPIFQMNLSSAVFHSLTIGVIFLILNKLTKSCYLSLVTCFVLAFSYLFWTYSLVVEAFALNDLFAAILILVAIYFYQAVKDKKFKSVEKVLLLFTFCFSLSLAHHQTIILLFPGFLFLFFKSGFRKRLSYLLFAKLLFAGLLGLLPYLYLPIAASFNPPANWGNPTSLARLFAVVTRAEFGTFRSSVLGPQHIGFERFVQIGWYFDFLKADFFVLGVAIGILGAFWFFIKDRTFFWFFALNFLVCGPFFLFYANFPTNNPFYLEVVQRFVLLSYPFFAVFLAFGFLALKSILNKLLSLVLHDKNLLPVTCLPSEASAKLGYLPARQSLLLQGLAGGLLNLFAFCFLLFAFLATWPKADLSKKYIGGNFAHDALVTSQNPSVMSLEDDTLLFNSQAVNAIYKINPKTSLVIGPKMNDSIYLQVLKSHTQNFSFPKNVDPEKLYFVDFLKANLENYEFYTMEGGYEVEGGIWLPVGVLSRFYPDNLKPTNEEFDRLQEEVWSRYKNDPETLTKTGGNLTFEHIASLYASAHARVANEYFERGNFPKAKKHLQEALVINPKLVYAHVILGEILSKEGKCQEAMSEFSLSYELDKSFIGSFLEKSVTARDCLKDDKLSAEYFSEYSRLTQAKEKPF